MTTLGLLTGMVQAYIFSILAAVYIAAATHVREPRDEDVPLVARVAESENANAPS